MAKTSCRIAPPTKQAVGYSTINKTLCVYGKIISTKQHFGKI